MSYGAMAKRLAALEAVVAAVRVDVANHEALGLAVTKRIQKALAALDAPPSLAEEAAALEQDAAVLAEMDRLQTEGATLAAAERLAADYRSQAAAWKAEYQRLSKATTGAVTKELLDAVVAERDALWGHVAALLPLADKRIGSMEERVEELGRSATDEELRALEDARAAVSAARKAVGQ